MGDVDIQSIPPLRITELTHVEPLEISRISGIAPAAIHVKELNHIDPISVESLRVDEVRNIDPVRVERFDVTHLPTVNVSLTRAPSLDLNLRRMPPVAIAVRQQFVAPSEYTVHAKLLGFEFLRLQIHGKTVLAAHDGVPRERSHVHNRSFPDVAALGNPGIPVRRTERVVVQRQTHPHHASPPAGPRAHADAPLVHRGARTNPRVPRSDDLSAGRPAFNFSLHADRRDESGGSVSSGEPS
jgi:hypothetical protein